MHHIDAKFLTEFICVCVCKNTSQPNGFYSRNKIQGWYDTLKAINVTHYAERLKKPI